MLKLDAQIIISREDNTDFFSLGFIQTDASLISALGGALASFAEEIGLTGGEGEAVETRRSTAIAKNDINYSRFQNGVLASKMVEVGDYRPIILIAIKGFEGEDKELEFIVNYATALAERVVSTFENDYSSIGFVPRIDQALEIIFATANQMQRSSSEQVKYFAKSISQEIRAMLDDLWANQDNLETCPLPFRESLPFAISQRELQRALAQFFYLKGAKENALFPLVFAPSTTPLNEVAKIIDDFLKKKAIKARKEIIKEIQQITTQLKESSKSRSKRGVIEISDVDLINEDIVFEKVLVTKNENLEQAMNKLIANFDKELYSKLFQRYPLKFLAMAKEAPFIEEDVDEVVKKTLALLLKEELADKVWINNRLFRILRKVTAKFSPNDVINKRDKILEKINDEFITLVKKEHPFIVFADPSLSQLARVVKGEAEKSLEKFKTSHDEAVVLWNVIGEIHSSIGNETDPSIADLMNLYFLHAVVHSYPFREVPEIVYSLIKDILGKMTYCRRAKPEIIFENNMNLFEEKLGFKTVPETKQLILKRLSKAKPTHQGFENFENLAFFFKSYRSALEMTLTKILQTIFSPEKFPSPPKALIRMIEELVTSLQSLIAIKNMIEGMQRRPSGRELFSKEVIQVLAKNTKFKQILPKPIELAREACKEGWMKGAKQEELTDTQLQSLKVIVPSMNLEEKLMSVLNNPQVLEKLWLRYSHKIIKRRQKELAKHIENYEKRSKISAGDISGKKKFGNIAKKLKRINKALGNVLSGGGFMRKIFSGSKDIASLFLEASKVPFSGFRQYPGEILTGFDYKSFFKVGKNHLNVDPMIGNFQDLMGVYAAIWIADSEYIDQLEDKLFWDGINRGSSSNSRSPLEKKILQNLKGGYSRKVKGDQKTIIRSTIEEEVVPIFNKTIRQVIVKVFDIFKSEKTVKYDKIGKDWFISIGTLNLPINYLKNLFGTLEKLQFAKISNEQTELRWILTDLFPRGKAKESVSIQEFLRKALLVHLNKREFKALEILGELTERFIGKNAGNTFFSYTRILAQLILSPVE